MEVGQSKELNLVYFFKFQTARHWLRFYQLEACAHFRENLAVGVKQAEGSQ